MTRTIVTELACVVRILSRTAAGVTLALSVVFASTVPDWCDAAQVDANEQCVTTGGIQS